MRWGDGARARVRRHKRGSAGRADASRDGGGGAPQRPHDSTLANFPIIKPRRRYKGDHHYVMRRAPPAGEFPAGAPYPLCFCFVFVSEANPLSLFRPCSRHTHGGLSSRSLALHAL